MRRSGSLYLNRLVHYPSDRRTPLYLIGTASGDWSNLDDFSVQTLPDAALAEPGECCICGRQAVIVFLAGVRCYLHLA